jgi:hypothetical protein
MAAKNQPRIKLDDFVAAVRGDPSASEPLLFTSGYVGRSPTEGNVRIYSDPSLSRWIEAAEEDVVHSIPIADSPLGGSHLWLRGSARISPGVVGGPTGEPIPGLPEGPLTLVPRTLEPCLETRHPMCIQQWPPITRLAVCPTLPPVCFPMEQHPIATLACAAAAQAEPAFTEPPICAGPSGHIPCANYTENALRGGFTVHFCARPRLDRFPTKSDSIAIAAGTIWQSCACPSPSAGPWNC